MTTNWRSASERCAMVTIAAAGLPSSVFKSRSMSNGTPWAHAANDGDASSPLSRSASAVRSDGGKNVSRSKTPSLRIGGYCTCPTSVARSRSRPALHEAATMFDSRMCSRLDSGSASTSTSPSRPDTNPSTSSRDRLGIGALRRCKEPTRLSGTPGCGAGRVDRQSPTVLRGRAMRSGATPQDARPSRHFVASCSANASGVEPARCASPSLIHGRKSDGRSSGNVRREVREVALRIDDERGHARQQRLLEQHDAEAGLARPGHADDHAVGREVARGEHAAASRRGCASPRRSARRCRAGRSARPVIDPDGNLAGDAAPHSGQQRPSRVGDLLWDRG